MHRQSTLDAFVQLGPSEVDVIIPMIRKLRRKKPKREKRTLKRLYASDSEDDTVLAETCNIETPTA